MSVLKMFVSACTLATLHLLTTEHHLFLKQLHWCPNAFISTIQNIFLHTYLCIPLPKIPKVFLIILFYGCIINSTVVALHMFHLTYCNELPNDI